MITSLSYLYDKNDQSTLSSEKTHISVSDKTSNYPAATNDIDLDATVLGERCHMYLADLDTIDLLACDTAFYFEANIACINVFKFF